MADVAPPPAVGNRRIDLGGNTASIKRMLWGLFGAAVEPAEKDWDDPNQQTGLSSFLRAEHGQQQSNGNLPSISLRTNSVTAGPPGAGAAVALRHHPSLAGGPAGLLSLHPPALSPRQPCRLGSAVALEGAEPSSGNNPCSTATLSADRQGSGGMHSSSPHATEAVGQGRPLRRCLSRRSSTGLLDNEVEQQRLRLTRQVSWRVAGMPVGEAPGSYGSLAAAAGGPLGAAAAAAFGSEGAVAAQHHGRRSVRSGVQFPGQGAVSELGGGQHPPDCSSDGRGWGSSGPYDLGSMLLMGKPGEAGGRGGGEDEGGVRRCYNQAQLSPSPAYGHGQGSKSYAGGGGGQDGRMGGPGISPLVHRRPSNLCASTIGSLGLRTGRSGKYGPDPTSNLTENSGWRSRH